MKMIDKFAGKFSKYEIARILGARSLQIAMDAPVLLKMSEKELDDLNFDSLRIAEKEFESEVLPITVKRPLPKKSEKMIKKLTEEEVKDRLEKQAEKEKKEIEKLEKKKEDIEETVEEEIKGEGEIMEMATPEDEVETEEVSESKKELQ